MSDLLVLAPLRSEALALRLGGVRVARTGMGAKAKAADAPVVVVAGVCGAVDPELRSGDVVVATELRDGDEAIRRVAGWATLARALRGRGLRVFTGPIFTGDRVLGAAEREALREAGVLAVDMESSRLAPSDARPFGVVRVVVDTAGQGLVHPRTLVTGTRALMTLRRLGPALEEWAGAGVERAIETVERALEQRSAPIYVRKQIVHNVHVVGDLERRGAVFVDELDEVPNGATVVFSAHGVSPQVKTIVLVGHRGHEEVEGTMGEAPDAIRLVEGVDDLATLDVDDPEQVAYLTQTTLAVDDTMVVVDELRFPSLAGPRSDDICYATQNRQQALRTVARDADLVLPVGSENSSNSQRLVDVAERESVPGRLIDDETDLDPAWLPGARTIALTAGASAPEGVVQRLIGELAGLGPVTVEDRTVGQESIMFNLPREVS
jgi:4-hydroxy-3-methylbut-2-enyl diphosphate reductase